MRTGLKVVTGTVPTDPAGDAFADISEVVPFLEAAPVTGVDASIHAYTPRAYKSHSTPESFPFAPHIGRFIVCVRNGLLTAPSFLDFSLDWTLRRVVQPAALREEVYLQYFRRVYLGMVQGADGRLQRPVGQLGPWFAHVKSWMETDRERVLYVVYEDMVRDLGATVRGVARFLGMPVSDAHVEEVVRRCRREFMADNPRFRDALISRGMGWSSDGGQRARPKDAAGFKQVELPDDCIAVYNEMFQEAFGVREYGELVEVLRSRNAASC